MPTGLKLDAFLAPLPPAERSALRAKLGLGADDLALTFVGRLAKEKNVSELLAFLPAAPRNVKLLLVGDGPCWHELEAQARERGLTDRVLFAGMAAPERVADCYKAGDVFVSASRSETQGLTYLEAMASGLPLLCREDDCLKGVLSPGENGFSYTARAEVRREEFPTRVYEDVTLEAGMYDALIVELGTGEGANWWCVLYPPMCFSGEATGENIVFRSRIAEIIRSFFAD